jgi:hypothetical protein
MRSKPLFLLIVILLLPKVAGAVTDEDFEARTTRDLLSLCTVSSDAARHQEAIHFCHGYLVGAFDYHIAATAAGEEKRLVCMPSPPPSRNRAVGMFVDWARAHPEYMDEKPVETEFRFLIETWPCK